MSAVPNKTTTLLWALRSPCDLGCPHCYFGVLEQDRIAPPTQPGKLTHLPGGDAPLPALLDFLADVGDSGVARVFLAGGEPLNWPPIQHIITALTTAGVQVVVCTNGRPLTRPNVRKMLFDAGVHAVSVSLDSADPVINDRQRPPRGNQTGSWNRVIAGISALLADRGDRSMKVGIYSVLTRRTLAGMPDTARFAAGLGVDYFVAQPVALEPGHELSDELVLREQDVPLLEQVFDEITTANLGMTLPSHRYPAQVVSTVRHRLQDKQGCFGGHQLVFVEPDGSVWDCPSGDMIAAQAAAGTQRTIIGHTAAELFAPTTAVMDCPLFSSDCVNMNPLMEFDRILGAA
ncbi:MULTISPECIES: radical SAM protein [Nocardia]|uniref:radical SAM protein n=1 Tax=Nocardia TaxID=1817 RepID=UPI0024588AFA|nr:MULTISPECIES: radical SAM protein [Nocardia]